MSTDGSTAAHRFLSAFARRDAASAAAEVAPDARVTFHGLGRSSIGPELVGEALRDITTAFPDLRVTVKRVLITGNVVTAELKAEGTQAADYAGAINQEKHLDLDEGWRFQLTCDRITALDVYWCQQQLYRRLAVKRFDQVAIV
ncbi:nuclear transport factor 2 family protein [Kribbella sp. GL6]|uniref:nuclear transport factor 2 family protein n=1 Tax=Kribbella sp. GL6 TaxID=3419765 RepID=UPI003D04C1A8